MENFEEYYQLRKRQEELKEIEGFRLWYSDNYDSKGKMIDKKLSVITKNVIQIKNNMTREEFLHDVVNNDLNHRILLWEAIQLTTDTIIEFGSGHGSTPYLRQFCKSTDRLFKSYDNNKDWCDVTGAMLVDDWSKLNEFGDVLFIDHAPGEDRKLQIEKYKNKFAILVIHDTEPAQEHGYQMRSLFPQFKYWVEIKTNGAEATMVSNYIDLSSTIGKGNTNYPYTIQNAR